MRYIVYQYTYSNLLLINLPRQQAVELAVYITQNKKDVLSCVVMKEGYVPSDEELGIKRKKK